MRVLLPPRVVRLVWTLAAIVPLVFVASVADAQDGGAASARADASPRVPAVAVVANDGGLLDASSSAPPSCVDRAARASKRSAWVRRPRTPGHATTTMRLGGRMWRRPGRLQG